MYQCNLNIDHIDTFFLYHLNLKDISESQRYILHYLIFVALSLH